METTVTEENKEGKIQMIFSNDFLCDTYISWTTYKIICEP